VARELEQLMVHSITPLEPFVFRSASGSDARVRPGPAPAPEGLAAALEGVLWDRNAGQLASRRTNRMGDAAKLSRGIMVSCGQGEGKHLGVSPVIASID
jgi:hypothetical protein